MNIRPANVLLFDIESQQMNVKLADYGEFTHRDVPGADSLTKAFECLDGSEYTAKGDVWQLGILFFTMLTWKLPFAGRNSKKI